MAAALRRDMPLQTAEYGLSGAPVPRFGHCPGQIADIDARIDLERPRKTPADAVRTQRCSTLHGDGRDGGGGAHRSGRRPCHPHGSRAARGTGAKGRAGGGTRRARCGPDRLYLRARHPFIAGKDRATLPRYLWLSCRSGADRGHHGFIGRVHPGVPCDVRARRSGRGDRAGLSAVPPHPHRARLRAGADRDHERHAPCADRRGLAGGASQDAAARGCWSAVPPIRPAP